MNSIVGITEILLRSRHSPKEQEYLLNIQSSGRVLLTIINDVLDCSKMEAGKMQLFDEPYDTCSLFHDLRISMENRIGHSGLELIYDIDQDIPCKLKGQIPGSESARKIRKFCSMRFSAWRWTETVMWKEPDWA